MSSELSIESIRSSTPIRSELLPVCDKHRTTSNTTQKLHNNATNKAHSDKKGQLWHHIWACPSISWDFGVAQTYRHTTAKPRSLADYMCAHSDNSVFCPPKISWQHLHSVQCLTGFWPKLTQCWQSLIPVPKLKHSRGSASRQSARSF